jgi:hypothetical protein
MYWHARWRDTAGLPPTGTRSTTRRGPMGLPSPVYHEDHNPPGPHTNTDWQAESPRRADVIVFRAIESPLNGRASSCFKPIVLRREPGSAVIRSLHGGGLTVTHAGAQVSLDVVATYTPEAFDNKGDSPNVSQPIFSSLANALAPHTLPSQ